MRTWARERAKGDRHRLGEAAIERLEGLFAEKVGGGGTFSWISKDYERLPESAEAFIYVAMRRPMVRRLARS